MEKAETTFLGFLLSLKNISLTLIVNFVVGAYFYTLIYDFESFFISNGWILSITIFMAFVWIAFMGLSYRTWKAKKIEGDKTELKYKI